MTLETLLKQRIPPPPSDQTTFIGTYHLYHPEKQVGDNPALALHLLSALAESGKIASYGKFQQCFKPSPAESMKAPKASDPVFEAPFSGFSPSKRQILKVANYLKAKTDHDKRNQANARLQARSRTVAQNFNPDIRGYFSFMCHPAFASGGANVPKSLSEADRFFFRQTHKFALKEKDRQRHTYITAGTGHGKSTTIETLIHQDLTHDYTKNPGKNPAIVLIDPHGDLAKTCARFKVNFDNDRLVYIKPSLSKTHIPTSNPLDIQTDDWDVLKNASRALVDTFAEIMGGNDNRKGGFTNQMEAILQPCLTALLTLKNASLVDLMRFMDDDPAQYQALMNHAKQKLTNPMQRETLINDFNKDSYNPSKLSIKTKIRSLLNDDHFYHYLVGQSTFDLEAEINHRRFIVFDVSGLGEGTVSIGRFIMAQLVIIALKRANVPQSQRIPIHLYVDEVHHFISESFKKIVTEARKFKLYGTFAQQFCGQDMNTAMKKAIIGNSGIKISGKNELSSLKTMSAETGATIEELQNLSTGQFHIKAGNLPSVAVNVPKVPQKAMMTREQWLATLKQQMEKYYRPLFQKPLERPENPDTSLTGAGCSSPYHRTPQRLKSPFKTPVGGNKRKNAFIPNPPTN